ncbi:MAG: DmsC/YnfH family molybdoenzyme membrane anchor subunit [Sulfolobaceae archaeon]
MSRKLAFIFDHQKCIVCNACVDACNKAYGNLNWRKLPILVTDNYKTALSISCNHCENPLCMKVCPASAYELDQEFGILRINPNKCIGCRYCQWACPYEAPTINEVGIMTKCHFCYDRIKSNKGLPYCVEACPTGALSFGWLEENIAVDVNYLAPKEITKPRLLVKSSELVKGQFKTLKQVEERNYIGLLLYTILIEISLGFLIFNIPHYNIFIIIFLFLGFIPSIFHVTRRERLFRVIFNLKSSWLSREVATGALALLLFLINLILPSTLILASIFLLLSFISSLMIYLVKTRPSWYNIDTPISFIGSIFTISGPLSYYLNQNFLAIILAIMFLSLEIFSAYYKSKKYLIYRNDFKVRTYFNISAIIFNLISLPIVPYLSIISILISLISEIYYRRIFFKKILTYALPYI